MTPIEQQAREIAERHGWPWESFSESLKGVVLEALNTTPKGETMPKQCNCGGATDCDAYTTPTKPDELPEWALREAMTISTEDVARLLVERGETENQWQPIKTAPKDGSYVDLWCAPLSYTEIALTPCRVPNCYWVPDYSAWYWSPSRGEPIRVWHRVTHWMLPPEPPKSDEPKDDPDLVLAREMAAQDADRQGAPQTATALREGKADDTISCRTALRTIKHLREAGWKEGV